MRLERLPVEAVYRQREGCELGMANLFFAQRVFVSVLAGEEAAGPGVHRLVEEVSAKQQVAAGRVDDLGEPEQDERVEDVVAEDLHVVLLEGLSGRAEAELEGARWGVEKADHGPVNVA